MDSLCKKPLNSMNKLRERAKGYIQMEEMSRLKNKVRQDESKRDRREGGRKTDSHKSDKRHKLDKLQPLPKEPRSRLTRAKYSRYHYSHDHITKDCWALKENIEERIRVKHLSHFIKWMDNHLAGVRPGRHQEDQHRNHDADRKRDRSLARLGHKKNFRLKEPTRLGEDACITFLLSPRLTRVEVKYGVSYHKYASHIDPSTHFLFFIPKNVAPIPTLRAVRKQGVALRISTNMTHAMFYRSSNETLALVRKTRKPISAYEIIGLMRDKSVFAGLYEIWA
ncbi:hypothetical protein JHK82_016174 [Glycine max]|nr:hypothetical protein JHK82_016174 [Glycine max]